MSAHLTQAILKQMPVRMRHCPLDMLLSMVRLHKGWNVFFFLFRFFFFSFCMSCMISHVFAYKVEFDDLGLCIGGYAIEQILIFQHEAIPRCIIYSRGLSSRSIPLSLHFANVLFDITWNVMLNRSSTILVNQNNLTC